MKARIEETAGREGRTNRCRYLRASSSVEESDRKTPPDQRNTRLMTSEVIISTMANPKTISGLIFTPWVSSLKKVSRPALEAGIGAPFFLLLMHFARAPRFLSLTTLCAHLARQIHYYQSAGLRAPCHPQKASMQTFANSSGNTKVGLQIRSR
jgi:hypothetical protein